MPAASSPLGLPTPVLGVSHPLYVTWRPIWTRLHDVYEGSGGFLDPKKPYLVAHPREWLDHSTPTFAEDGVTVVKYEVNPNPSSPSPKLKERRTLARYENIAETLVETLAGALFRVAPQRTFNEKAPKPNDGSLRPIEAFWANADGLGTTWDALLAQAWIPAAVFGYLFGYLDLDEDTDLPIVRFYTPLDVPDWLTDDRGALTSIKFLEATPREDFTRIPTSAAKQVRVRVIDAEGWTLTKPNGTTIDEGTHPFGVLPVFVLYAKRRSITPLIGKSVLGDPQNFLDLYNLVSEVRELLRKQTFSILNIPIGKDGNVEHETQLIGRQSGTGNILFSTEAANYISAEGSNVQVYHEHIDRLIRTIYRLAVLPWDSDSRDAEAAESRRIKREDLNQALCKYANECKRVDEFVTDLVYRARFGAAWENWRERDALAIHWPDQFETTPLEDLLKQFSDAVAMELGETATKEAKKRAVRAALPNLSAEMLETIDGEIDAAEYVTESERRDKELNARIEKLAGAGAAMGA